MNITVNELLKGKATIIKDKEFLQTEAYVTPFLNQMSKLTSDFKVHVEKPDQITLTKDGNINYDDITYNRVWIEAIMPEEYNFDNHSEVVGMVYGLDTKTPVAKFYRGGINNACTNLCVFNPSFLSVQELKPEVGINYNPVTSLLEQTNDLKLFLDKLHKTEFNYTIPEIDENLGKWIRNTLNLQYNNGFQVAKISDSTAISAYKSLFKDKKSSYFIDPTKENVNMFKVYNAFTDIITNDKDKDIINKVEKTLLLKNILAI